MAATVLKIYVPGSEPGGAQESHDPGVAWSADVLTGLANMGGEFLMAVVGLGAFLVRSLVRLVIGR